MRESESERVSNETSVCVRVCVCMFLLRGMHLSASVDDRQQIREAEAR